MLVKLHYFYHVGRSILTHGYNVVVSILVKIPALKYVNLPGL